MPQKAWGLATAVLGAGLGVLAAVRLFQAAAALGLPFQLDYAEPVLYNQAWRLLRAEPLYQPLGQPPYSVAAYPPLYYTLGAVLHVVFGPGFGPGRVLSFAAGVFAAGLVANLTATRAKDFRAGLFAAVLFLAAGFPGFYPWMALYRVDALGVALSLAAVATLSRRSTSTRLVVAGLLAGLALLTKQTFVAALAGGAIWLWRRDRHAALLFATSALGLVILICGALELMTGGALLTNVIEANENPFTLRALLENLITLALYQAAPIAVATLCLRRTRPMADLVPWYWAATFLPVAGLAKIGALHNYWIELAAATAVLSTLGLWQRLVSARPGARPGSGAWVALLLLAVGTAAVGTVQRTIVLEGVDIPQPSASELGEFRQLVERVRSEQGGVLAEPMDVVALANRPILLEPFIFSILDSEHQWNPEPLVAQICAGDVKLLVLGYSIEQAHSLSAYGINVWPPPVLAALDKTMVLESVQAERYVYAPRQVIAGCSTAAEAHTS